MALIIIVSVIDIISQRLRKILILPGLTALLNQVNVVRGDKTGDQNDVKW